MNQLLTLGYARWTLDQIDTAVREHDALLVDVRLNPFSRKPGFSKKALQERLGDRYRHVPALGNVNYRGGPIELRDPDTGFHVLLPHLDARPVILMCGCADVETCHRKTVADQVAERLPNLDIVHLEPPDEAREGFVKAISLWQPWASLCCIPHPDDPARSVKGFETRSWRTNHRGLLVIHAAQRFMNDQRDWCYEPLIREALRRAGYAVPSELPRGALIGTVNLTQCHPAEALRSVIDEHAGAMGNYDDGRFGWEITRPALFETPVPYRGQQGLFGVPARLIPTSTATENT